MSYAKLEHLRVKLFCDCADYESILAMAGNPLIRGFTTNPTLMRKAGISDYEEFARKVLATISNHPISFEVFADDIDEMGKQARVIASWGANVNVKVPVTNTRGEFTGRLIQQLSAEGIAVNVTAVMSLAQVDRIAEALEPGTPAIVSVFAGRIADTGTDPMPLMIEALRILRARPKAELLWASPRELLNVFQANEIGCHIITATPEILSKLSLIGKKLDSYSLDTVRMFYQDATAAGYAIADETGDSEGSPSAENAPNGANGSVRLP